jgi:antirestriction protein ArdC
VRKYVKASAAPASSSGKFFDSESEEQQQEGTNNSLARQRCFARAYHVFNAAQVAGYREKPKNVLLSETERIWHAEAFFSSLPATIRHGGDRAYYSPAGEYIQMLYFAEFESAEKYANVLLHELTHWAGAKNRLNRDLSGRFGDARYAMEEMIAELFGRIEFGTESIS